MLESDRKNLTSDFLREECLSNVTASQINQSRTLSIAHAFEFDKNIAPAQSMMFDEDNSYVRDADCSKE